MKATKEQIKNIIKLEKERKEILKDSLGRYNEEEEVFERVSKAYIKALQHGHDVEKSFKLRCNYLDKKFREAREARHKKTGEYYYQYMAYVAGCYKDKA